MRLLIATGLYPPEPGGPATYTRLLEERLPARGIEVSVLAFARVRGLPRVVRHIAYFLLCLLASRKVDIVFAQDTVSVGFPAALAARIARKPFFVRVPGDYAWEQARSKKGVRDTLEQFQKKEYGPRIALLRFAQRTTLRLAKKIIVPSEYLGRIVYGWGMEPHLIYNGIEIPPEAEKPKARPEGFLIASAGRRTPWKGFEALESVVAKERGWHLHIAEGVSRREALGWALAADVFVLNSEYEGLSHTLLEVMALGRPIIATAVGGNPELIKDEVTGLLIPPRNEKALHEALRRIEEDPEGARARAARAQAKAQEFSIDRTLDALVALMKSFS
jgi:glycosyltransferase involved in cell wall biosynthesis